MSNLRYTESPYPGAFGFLPDGKPALEDVRIFYAFAKHVYNVVKNHLKTHCKEEQNISRQALRIFLNPKPFENKE